MSRLAVVRAGQLDYLESWDFQRRLVRARRDNRISDTLLLTEHPPTYTIGRRGSRQNLLIDDTELDAIGASCYEIDRGGDITFHGPGQIVGYLIHDLGRASRSMRRFVTRIEQTLIATLASFGISGQVDPARPGVWVDGEKIAVVGIAVSRGVTYHGFALNLDPDLSYFDHMIPCGIPDAGVTSIERLTGKPVVADDVIPILVKQICDRFMLTPDDSIDLHKLQRIAASDVEPLVTVTR